MAEFGDFLLDARGVRDNSGLAAIFHGEDKKDKSDVSFQYKRPTEPIVEQSQSAAQTKSGTATTTLTSQPNALVSKTSKPNEPAPSCIFNSAAECHFHDGTQYQRRGVIFVYILRGSQQPTFTLALMNATGNNDCFSETTITSDFNPNISQDRIIVFRDNRKAAWSIMLPDVQTGQLFIKVLNSSKEYLRQLQLQGIQTQLSDQQQASLLQNQTGLQQSISGSTSMQQLPQSTQIINSTDPNLQQQQQQQQQQQFTSSDQNSIQAQTSAKQAAEIGLAAQIEANLSGTPSMSQLKHRVQTDMSQKDNELNSVKKKDKKKKKKQFSGNVDEYEQERKDDIVNEFEAQVDKSNKQEDHEQEYEKKQRYQQRRQNTRSRERKSSRRNRSQQRRSNRRLNDDDYDLYEEADSEGDHQRYNSNRRYQDYNNRNNNNRNNNNRYNNYNNEYDNSYNDRDQYNRRRRNQFEYERGIGIGRDRMLDYELERDRQREMDLIDRRLRRDYNEQSGVMNLLSTLTRLIPQQTQSNPSFPASPMQTPSYQSQLQPSKYQQQLNQSDLPLPSFPIQEQLIQDQMPILNLNKNLNTNESQIIPQNLQRGISFPAITRGISFPAISRGISYPAISRGISYPALISNSSNIQQQQQLQNNQQSTSGTPSTSYLEFSKKQRNLIQKNLSETEKQENQKKKDKRRRKRKNNKKSKKENENDSTSSSSSSSSTSSSDKEVKFSNSNEDEDQKYQLNNSQLNLQQVQLDEQDQLQRSNVILQQISTIKKRIDNLFAKPYSDSNGNIFKDEEQSPENESDLNNRENDFNNNKNNNTSASLISSSYMIPITTGASAGVLISAVESVVAENDRLQKESEELRSQLTQQQQCITSLQQKISSFQSQSQQRQQDSISVQLKEKQVIEEENKRLNERIETILKENNEVRIENVQVKQKVNNIERENNEKKLRIIELETELSKIETNYLQVKQKENEIKKDKQNLIQRSSQSERERIELKAQLQTLQNELDREKRMKDEISLILKQKITNLEEVVSRSKEAGEAEALKLRSELSDSRHLLESERQRSEEEKKSIEAIFKNSEIQREKIVSEQKQQTETYIKDLKQKINELENQSVNDRKIYEIEKDKQKKNYEDDKRINEEKWSAQVENAEKRGQIEGRSQALQAAQMEADAVEATNSRKEAALRSEVVQLQKLAEKCKLREKSTRAICLRISSEILRSSLLHVSTVGSDRVYSFDGKGGKQEINQQEKEIQIGKKEQGKKDKDKKLSEKQSEKVKDEKEKEIIIFARDNVISALRETINVETTRSTALLHKRLERALGEEIEDIKSDKLGNDQNSSKQKKQEKQKQREQDEQNEIDSDVSSYPICFAIEKPKVVTKDEEIQTIPKAASSNAATQTQTQVQVKIEREYKQDENKPKDEKTSKDKDKSKEKQKKKQKIVIDESSDAESEEKENEKESKTDENESEKETEKNKKKKEEKSKSDQKTSKSKSKLKQTQSTKQSQNLPNQTTPLLSEITLTSTISTDLQQSPEIAVSSEQTDEKKVQQELNAINSDNKEKVENINDNVQKEAENEIKPLDEQQQQESLVSPQVTTQSEQTPQSITVPQTILSVNSEQANQVNKKQATKKITSLFEDDDEEEKEEQKIGKKKIDSLFGESETGKGKEKAKEEENEEEEEEDDEDGLGAVISFIKPPIVQKDSSSKSSKPDQTNSDSTIEQSIPNQTSSLSLSTKNDSEKNITNNKQGKTENIGKVKGKNAQGNNKGKSSSSNSGGLFDDDEDPLA